MSEKTLKTILKGLAPYRIDEKKISLTKTILGRGEFGVVILGEIGRSFWKPKMSGTLVAVKQLHTIGTTTENRELAMAVMKEMNVWAGLAHPSITPLVGFYLSDNMERVGLVSPFMKNGNIRRYLDQHSPHMIVRLDMFGDVGSGVAYLHSRNICHGDIRGENVLVDDAGRAKLSDVGLIRVTENGTIGGFASAGLKGSIRHMAPELLRDEHPQRTKTSDVWAWTCLGLEVLFDQVPYGDMAMELAIMARIIRGEPPLDLNGFDVDEGIKQLFRGCWAAEPQDRVDIDACVIVVKRVLEPKPSNAIATRDPVPLTRALSFRSSDDVSGSSAIHASSTDLAGTYRTHTGMQEEVEGRGSGMGAASQKMASASPSPRSSQLVESAGTSQHDPTRTQVPAPSGDRLTVGPDDPDQSPSVAVPVRTFKDQIDSDTAESLAITQSTGTDQHSSQRLQTDQIAHGDEADIGPSGTDHNPLITSLVEDIGEGVVFDSVEPFDTRGHFCDLFLGNHRTAGKVALKRLRHRGGDDGDIETMTRHFNREKDIWMGLRHDRVLQCLGMFSRERNLYLVSPFMKNGSLFDWVRFREHIGLERLRLIHELADALVYLHLSGIVHGDVKANNVLLSDDIHVQLCDFGLTKLAQSATTTTLKGAGSIRWQSPELWENDPKTFKSDVYAFAMTIVEVLTGQVPFATLLIDSSVMRAVLAQDERPAQSPESSPDGTSYASTWLVAARCWVGDANERISMAEAVELFKST